MVKRRTVREVQHQLAEILAEVQSGEVVLITKRGRVLAKILRASEDEPSVAPKQPDFAARLAALFPDGPPPGPTASELIIDMRERF